MKCKNWRCMKVLKFVEVNGTNPRSKQDLVVYLIKGYFLSGQSGEGRKRRQLTLRFNLIYANSAKSVFVKPSDILK